jgi:hypothetical protein
MATSQKLVNDNNGEPVKNGFQDLIKEILSEKIKGDGLNNENHKDTRDFILNLYHSLGWGYGQFIPYTNGNYAVFMQHGPWLKTAISQNNSGLINNYVSSLDKNKRADSTQNNILEILGTIGSNEQPIKFSQTILDIDIPEISKEYTPVSTRQKNSFINTRDFTGSDFTMNFLENKKIEVFKYHEMWHKSIELIRDGLMYVPEIAKITNEYLIPNPYSNAVYILIFEPKSMDIAGLIVLFGVLPINLPFKNLVGDRNGAKVTQYTMNYKFVDLQYAFYDGWDKFIKSAKIKGTLANYFSKFANLNGGS